LKPLLQALNGSVQNRPPIWLMRQAGRYLEEYRAIRAKSKSFLDFCYSPELAIEATLQPIRRFGFDAAIVFSDILVIPDALGQKVAFVEGEGPRLEALQDVAAIDALASRIDLERLAPVYATLRGAKAALPKETTLIGFAGAPWTLATYMIAGRGTPDQGPARRFAYRDRAAFERLILRLEQACVDHLIGQIEAGAEVVQIFDSWAGILPEAEFHAWCEAPVARIVAALKKLYPKIPVIAFPRAIAGGYQRFVEKTGIDAISIDTAARFSEVAQAIPHHVTIQGNLDPLVLVAGGQALERSIDDILTAAQGRPHIFNLGHGILPETSIKHVEMMLRRVRG
jgi:uroporphyrinogen decarboxylase